ncbi:nuclear transport factor 2 family protein [Clostridium folliculivorans]|uniref:Polyketide cyclase n=1 Tax=Clostridium folliculivorans TaxID=2886038 RepID=A0A9W5Y6D1_9CLOT|nr:ester cyclase [Clostridium folliculivorans]GKU27415.1 polyketide cyclase [Clostridium folliculivorans]GKU32266.1 polyketide cyclase [Clostridium folliculivorans]
MENGQKEIAKAFLQGVVTDKVREVYDLYTLPNFKHHNVFFSGDRESLLQGMLQSNEMFPNKKLTIKLAVAESPYVTLLSHVQITEGKEVTVVHMYRFEGEKIAEMWDISQEIPQNSPNENGVF